MDPSQRSAKAKTSETRPGMSLVFSSLAGWYKVADLGRNWGSFNRSSFRMQFMVHLQLMDFNEVCLWQKFLAKVQNQGWKNKQTNKQTKTATTTTTTKQYNISAKQKWIEKWKHRLNRGLRESPKNGKHRYKKRLISRTMQSCCLFTSVFQQLWCFSKTEKKHKSRLGSRFKSGIKFKPKSNSSRPVLFLCFACACVSDLFVVWVFCKLSDFQLIIDCFVFSDLLYVFVFELFELFYVWLSFGGLRFLFLFPACQARISRFYQNSECQIQVGAAGPDPERMPDRMPKKNVKENVRIDARKDARMNAWKDVGIDSG